MRYWRITLELKVYSFSLLPLCKNFQRTSSEGPTSYHPSRVHRSQKSPGYSSSHWPKWLILQFTKKAEKGKASVRENFKQGSRIYSDGNLLGNYSSVIRLKLHYHWARGSQMYGEWSMSSPKANIPPFSNNSSQPGVL